MKKLLFITTLMLFVTSSQFAQNYLTPLYTDSYIGTRLAPLEEYNGFIINKSINENIGYRAVNSNDTGNGAIASFTAQGSGSLYTNGTTLTHFGANYFVPSLRGNGAIYSNKKLLICTSGDNDIDIMTGTAFMGMTPKFIIKTNGQLQIPIEPTNDNTGKLIGRLPNGKIVSVTLPVNTVVNTTTVNLSATDLDTQYPNATIGFRVHCLNILVRKQVYEKTTAGWIRNAVVLLN